LPYRVDLGVQARIPLRHRSVVGSADDPVPKGGHGAIALVASPARDLCLRDRGCHHVVEIYPNDHLVAMIRVGPDLFIAPQESQLRIEL
jgi:hypothetical protein